MFSKEFLWGGATAANQYEGYFDVDGRGESVIDYFPGGKKRMDMALACEIDIYNRDHDKHKYPNHRGTEFYTHYEEDIKLMAEMGFNVYRMSISWTRIFPTGFESEPNKKGLEFYLKVFKLLKEYNIKPLVTIAHFDVPVEVARKLDGWHSRETVDLYVKYAKVLLEEYRDYVEMWIPFNEINAGLFLPLMTMGTDLSKFDNKDQAKYQCLHHQLVANAMVTKIAHEINRNNKTASMNIGSASYPFNCDPRNVLANMIEERFFKYYLSDVQHFGEYPKYILNKFEREGIKLEVQQDDASLLLNNTVDFYTYSYYSSSVIDVTDDDLSGKGNMVVSKPNPFLKKSDWGWSIDPIGLRIITNEIYDRYKCDLMIVENGLGAADDFDGHTVNDTYRIDYFHKHIAEMDKCINIDGIPLIGFTPWGCIDLVSAGTGEMAKRYGFVYVDINDDGSGTGNRFKKKSFYWYKDVIENNGVDHL